jgi:hypothetical protein
VPLVKAKLTQALSDMFQGKPAFAENASAAGVAWASAYADYASGATAGVAVPAPGVITTKQSALGPALGTAFKTGADTNAPAIAAMESAFDVFWAAVPFAGPGATGAVSVVPPPPALTSALTAVFAAGVPASGPAPSAADQARAIADALHTWTTAIFVALSTGGSPPVPTPLA